MHWLYALVIVRGQWPCFDALLLFKRMLMSENCLEQDVRLLQFICAPNLRYVLCKWIPTILGWLGGAKVSCILCHRGVQLILAYSLARPAILVAGKGREVMFLFLLFLHFHSCSSFFPVPLFHLFFYLFCRFFFHSLGDDTK